MFSPSNRKSTLDLVPSEPMRLGYRGGAGNTAGTLEPNLRILPLHAGNASINGPTREFGTCAWAIQRTRHPLSGGVKDFSGPRSKRKADFSAVPEDRAKTYESKLNRCQPYRKFLGNKRCQDRGMRWLLPLPIDAAISQFEGRVNDGDGGFARQNHAANKRHFGK